jgi:hypothetical protein
MRFFCLTRLDTYRQHRQDEYGTGSGSDRVPFRLRELGVAERYRFRFCILRPTLALYAG